MAIPESQLETWSHQGSVTQSAATYNAIKKVLEATDTPYTGKNYKVFLQGSYGNDTNIYAESDVDIVIQCNDLFQHDLSELPETQKIAFHAAYANAAYSYNDFKRDVLSVLTEAYGDNVKSGTKAINIAEGGGRRKADVIAAVEFRRYHKFNGVYDENYDEGICFYDGSGQRIANYPKQHSKNLTKKHKDTQEWLKPVVRILKNLRGKLVEKEMLADDVAPSYYLEGLLYNVPLEKFGNCHGDCFTESINWILKADRANFVCANEQYYLLRENSPVTWRASKCDEFLAAATKLWNNW
jgi:hypothetical protein